MFATDLVAVIICNKDIVMLEGRKLKYFLKYSSIRGRFFAKTRRMSMAGHVACMGMTTNTYAMLLAGKPEERK